MSDPLFFDPQECNGDVRDYTRLLQRAARGHVLWEPCPVGHVGDCGQIRDGRFWKFFNVYESPPAGIPRLDAPGAPDELRTTVFENRDVLRSSESVSVSFHGGLPFTLPPATLSINAAMSWDKSEFAFLGFGGRQRVLEVLSPPRAEALQRYLVQYERHIRAAMGILSGDIVILGGVTRAPAWMGGVARCTSVGISGNVSLDIGAISIDWGASVTRSRPVPGTGPLASTASWALTRGPAGWAGESSHVEMSTVVVSPIRVKRRHKVISQLLSLLRNTASSSNTTLPGEAISDPPCIPCELSRTGALLGEMAQQMQNQAHSQGYLSGAATAATCGDTIEHDSDDSDVSLSSSEDDNLVEDDLLSIVMQKILDTHPSLEVVAGSWEVIADVLKAHPNVDFGSDIHATFKVAEGSEIQANVDSGPATQSKGNPLTLLGGTTDTRIHRGGLPGASPSQRSTSVPLQWQGASAQLVAEGAVPGELPTIPGPRLPTHPEMAPRSAILELTMQQTPVVPPDSTLSNPGLKRQTEVAQPARLEMQARRRLGSSPAAETGTTNQPVGRSLCGSLNSFAHDHDRGTSQYTLPEPNFATTFTPGLAGSYPKPHAQHAWGAPAKLEFTYDASHALLAQDQRLHSSASSSPGLPQHMAPTGGYHTTPSPPPPGQQQKTFSFNAPTSNAVRKRPRRRYDEIERLYPCNWPSCNKTYGTLNHLNAHVTMQRHGKKRSPEEFKEMRKMWRKQRKEEAALAATDMQRVSLSSAHDQGITSPRPGDFHAPMSLGFPSPTEFLPDGAERGVFTRRGMPPRMSLPDVALSGLSLDVTPAPPLVQTPSDFRAGGMALPSRQLAPILQPADLWLQQQQQPHDSPPQQVSPAPNLISIA